MRAKGERTLFSWKERLHGEGENATYLYLEANVSGDLPLPAVAGTTPAGGLLACSLSAFASKPSDKALEGKKGRDSEIEGVRPAPFGLLGRSRGGVVRPWHRRNGKL